MPGLRLTITSADRDRPILEATVDAFAASRGIGAEAAAEVKAAGGRLHAWVRDEAYEGREDGEVSFEFTAIDGALACVIADTGRPIASFGGTFGPVPAELADLGATLEDLRMVNLGAEGKRLSAVIAIAGLTADEDAQDAEAVGSLGSVDAGLTPAAIEVRDASPADASEIARMLYLTYGLEYPHVDFLHPDWIAESIQSGRFYSTVATFNDEVIGHHAMLIDQPGGAVESGAAVVHAAFRGLGVAGRMLEHSIERVRDAGVPAVLSRAVTHHPYSQRMEHSFGFRTTALMLGSARINDGGRVALLAAYLRLDSGPHAVSLPDAYREPLLAAYANAEVELLDADPATALASTADEPAITVVRDALTSINGSSVVTVGRWNEEHRTELVNTLRMIVRGNDEMVYCDLDLTALTSEELDEIIAFLLNYDFFYAGLMLFGRNGHDFLRMQAMLVSDVQVGEFVLEGEYSRSLRDIVLGDIGLLPSS